MTGIDGDLLMRLVKQSVQGFKGYTFEPYWISVEENLVAVNRPEILTQISSAGAWDFMENQVKIDLGNNILVLTNNELDIPDTAALVLESLGNLFKSTRAEHASMSFNKYQVFTNYLKIGVRNFGAYVPFNLEFIRIIPTI
jgi:hypothetical protein